MDGYINISGGTKIQFRSFGGPSSLTGWQGEVKGSQANQGKISLGPVNMILKNHGITQIPTDAARKVKSKDASVYADILEGYKKYSNAGKERIIDTVMKAPESWLYSKLQVTQLLDRIEGIRVNDKRNQVIEDLYLYASSQSKYSAAYYKLE